MRRSKALAKLRAGQPVRLCGLGNYVPHFVCHAAHQRFDCIWLDLEHRTMGQREVQALLAYSHLFDIDIMIRPPTTEKIGLYRYLEDGAAGLMIPHVSTPEKARELVQAVKFPPLGDRGFDGAGLDSNFLLNSGAQYVKEANEETFLCVQIETPQALDGVDEIASVEGVDCLFLGIADLGLRHTHSQGNRPTTEQVHQRIANAAARHGKAWGTPSRTLQDAAALRDAGAQFIAHGGEFPGLITELKRAANVFDDIYG